MRGIVLQIKPWLLQHRALPFVDHERLSFTFKDHKGQISYIATQHPLHETTEDFWRMVWDQKAHTVVMVNDEEKEKPVRLAVIGGEEMAAKRGVIRKFSIGFPNQPLPLLAKKVCLIPSI